MAVKTNTSAPYAAAATNWLTRITPKRLRVRLALLAALLLSLIQSMISIIFYGFTSDWLYSQVDQSLQTTAAQIALALNDDEPLERDDLEFDLNRDGLATAFLREQRFFVRVIDFADGEVISGGATLPVTGLARSSHPSFETVINHELPMRVYTLALEQTYALQVGQSLDAVINTQTQIARLLGVMMIPTAVLALLSGGYLAHRALRPVDAIIRIARAVSEQDLSRRITLNLSDDELGQLAQTFNRMLDRIEDAFQRQRQFTADAAHELRTPLSIMQTGLEVALAQPRPAQAYQETLNSMYEEVLRLSQLTAQLLTLARADAGTLLLDLHPMDLALLLNTVADQISVAAEHKNITLYRQIPPRAPLIADEDRIIQLVLNLLENAVKYTPAGGSITLALVLQAEQAQLSIADTGAGIAPEHLPHIFDRFYRADRARSRQHGGVGLGLAIARQIARLHGGDITIVSQLNVGSTFTVTLPLHPRLISV
jgi:heavy metal sensor kinase